MNLVELEAKTKLQVDALFTPGLALRDRIKVFEEFVGSLPQIAVPTKHEFIDGLYRRECHFPKGMLATGGIHTVDHMDVMLTGSMLVATEDGCKKLVAPCTLTSRAGQKKAGIALEPTIWISYHPTDKTTVEEVDADMLSADYLDIEGEVA